MKITKIRYIALALTILMFFYIQNVKSPETGIMGDNTDYATRYDMSGNTKVGVWGASFNVPSNDEYNITEIKAKIYNEFGANFRYGIYEITNGYASASLIAYTVVKNDVVYGSLVNATLTYPASFIVLDEGEYIFSFLCEATIGVYGGTRAGYDEEHFIGDSWGNGFSNTFGSGIHNSDFSRTIFAEYVEIPRFNYINHYFSLGMFFGGIIMMIYAPSWVAWKIKKVGVTIDTVERMGYAMLIFLIGFGLFLTYIYQGA